MKWKIFKKNKLNKTWMYIFIVDHNCQKLGSFSDGDYRRYSLQNEKIDSTVSISKVMNTRKLSLPFDKDQTIITRNFDNKINSITGDRLTHMDM